MAENYKNCVHCSMEQARKIRLAHFRVVVTNPPRKFYLCHHHTTMVKAVKDFSVASITRC